MQASQELLSTVVEHVVPAPAEGTNISSLQGQLQQNFALLDTRQRSLEAAAQQVLVLRPFSQSALQPSEAVASDSTSFSPCRLASSNGGGNTEAHTMALRERDQAFDAVICSLQDTIEIGNSLIKVQRVRSERQAAVNAAARYHPKKRERKKRRRMGKSAIVSWL